MLELRASRASGVDLDRVTVSAPGPGVITPSWGGLADLAALVLLVYLLAGRALSPLPRAPRIALAVAVVVAVVAVGWLALVHLPLTVALPHLVTTAVLTYVLLLAAEWVAVRLAPAPPLAARGAAVLVAGAFLVRYGAMALPESVIIDMPYHMKWMHELLAGNIAALTDPHGGLNAPPGEWNLAVIIPKSPLFYFAAAPLAWLPGDLETAIKALVCLLEASTVLFCYALAARFGRALGGWRAGLAAGAVYAVMPLSFRALAYGILPTILAQWLSVAFFTGLLYWLPALGTPAGRRTAGRILAGLGLLVLLAAALIAFPTIAVFDTVVLGGLVLTWLRRRPRRSVVLAGLLGTAWVGAIGIYYGVYIVDLLTRTLPELLGAPGAGTGSAAPAPSTVHWTGPLDLLGWTLDYLVSALPLILGGAGLAILWGLARRRDAPPDIRAARPLAALTAWWMLILPVFLVANYRFDMIGKHLYFTMVPLALGSGFFLDRLAQRGPIARRWAGLLLLALAASALLFWATRLVQASS